MKDLLVVGGVVILSLIALSRPIYGIMAYTCFAYINPNAFAWSYARTLPVAQLPALATILGFCFSASIKKRIPVHRETLLLMALWFTFSLSTLFAIQRDLALETYSRITKILFMVVIASALIVDKERLHWLLRVIALPLGLLAFKMGVFIIQVRGEASLLMGPEGTWLEANNTLGLVFVMVVPMLYYLSKLETNVWLQRLCKLMLLGCYPAVVYTYSRGAWLGLAAVTALLVFRSKQKALAVVGLGICMLVVIPILPSQLGQRYDALENYQEDGSAQSRLGLWEFCFNVAVSRPFTGGGFDLYSVEAYDKYLPGFSEKFPGKVWKSHSCWFSVLGEHGFPSFILWLALLGSCFASTLKMKTAAATYSSLHWVSSYACMIQAALLGYVVTGSFIDASYYEIIYHLILMVIVIKEIIRREVSDLSQGNDPRLPLDCSSSLVV